VDRGRDGGHSLVELLVALCLLAVLAAGLLRLLGGVLGALGRARASLEVRRSLAFALDFLSDDVQEAGFRVPCRAPPGGPLCIVLRARPGEDQLVIYKDVMLAGRGHLACPLPSGDPPPLSRKVRLLAQERVKLQPGDMLLMEDGRWEGLCLEGPLDLAPRVPGEAVVSSLEGSPQDHGEGAPVGFLRPWRRIVWRVVAGSGLVREEGPGAEPTSGWAVAECRIFRHVTRFRVETPLGEGAGRPPLVELTLGGQGPLGLRRELTLARAPRNPATP